jgi:hypothetical protein
MSAGTRSKLLWMAALVPLFAASVLPTRISTLVCRVTGAVMEMEVCCPASDGAQGPTQAQLAGENCCVLKAVDLRPLLSDSRYEGAPRISPPFVAAAPAAGVPLLPIIADHRRAARPPIVGPPLLLLKRSFLI